MSGGNPHGWVRGRKAALILHSSTVTVHVDLEGSVGARLILNVGAKCCSYESSSFVERLS
jgi:hypothetical protein